MFSKIKQFVSDHPWEIGFVALGGMCAVLEVALVKEKAMGRALTDQNRSMGEFIDSIYEAVASGAKVVLTEDGTLDFTPPKVKAIS